MAELALLSVADRVATLLLNRPEARNALSPGVIEALHTRLDELEGRTDVSVVVLGGAGRAFCAGMDLKLITAPDQTDDAARASAAAAGQAILNALAHLMLRLRRLGAVVLARVNGAAIGGGCGLAVAADIAITHADARIGFPEVALGICPAVVTPWLVRKVGPGRARRILLEGGVMTGREAHDLGIVDHLVQSADELEPACLELARRLAQGGAQALRATKSLLNDLDDSLNEPLARRCAELSARMLAGDEAQTLLRARQQAR